jgi:pimeloyl-ACP methyl ester carboxylesterase
MTNRMPEMTRRNLLAASAAAGLLALEAGEARAAGNPAIRPFKISVPQADIEDLRRRVNSTKFAEKEPVSDNSQGVPLATIKKLARYWGTDYDWRKCEARLNAVPNYLTEIDGLDIHFVHARSKHKEALPIVVTHGWPGSVVEQLKLVEPLTNPTAYGGTAQDAFHVVIPSMAGYGFSGKPTTTGWDAPRMARAWDVLMKRLGYQQYVAQGGDWGALVTEMMGVQAPRGLLAIHTNMPGAIPADINKLAAANAPVPAGLSADEKHAYEQLAFFFQNIAYAIMMGSKPQTLAALNDSPVGLASFMLDHDARSLELIQRTFDAGGEGLTKDDVLDNISLTYLTGSGVSSSRLYRENKLEFFTPKGVKIPVAVSAFPDELYQIPRSWCQRAFPKLIHYSKQPKGGHFAAFEQPQALTKDLRAAFRSLRRTA